MRLINRYICREVCSHALLGLVIFTFVFFIPQLVRLMEFVVRHSASPGRLALLFLCTFPRVLTFTLPIAVLVGVLIGLGRMSADSELIALSALGVGLRRVLLPVGVLALGTSILTLAITLWAEPAALRTIRQTQDQLMASEASFQIQPRVFDEPSPHMVLYVEDATASATHWRGVFLAETGSDGNSQLTLAEDAIVIADRAEDKLELHLHDGSTHEYAANQPDHYNVSTFAESDFPVEFADAGTGRSSEPSNAERPMSALLATTGPAWREARVELQERFAFPGACIVFAFLAVPLAARPRRGGRAMGFIVSLLLVCAYYLILVLGTGFARQGKLSPAVGVWAANFFTGFFGLALLPGMEHIRGENWFNHAAAAISAWVRDLRFGKTKAASAAANNGDNGSSRARLTPIRPNMTRERYRSGFPLKMDLYVLRNFLFYFGLILAGFIFLFEIFTFFELLDDIARHHTPFIIVTNYFRYQIPFLFYQIAPLGALVAALVTIGVMTKNNEIVAFKASGVSLYRLALPLVAASAALAAGLLVLDNTYLPAFNQRQDELRNEIKARPPQTYLQADRRWIFGNGEKVYNYAVFDPDQNLFGGLNVFELDPQTFQLRRRVHADRAVWSSQQNTWLLSDGWVRDFDGPHIIRYSPFRKYALAELSEPPSYFNSEVRQSQEMDWRELKNYIGELQQEGFDVTRLTVQLHKKLAFPLIAPIITMLAIPFALLVGTRGAVGGLAMGVGIAILYWAASNLLEALGGVGQLPALLAGWAPDAIFLLLASYFFLKMPT
jgi:LPS export ABC transporter permease LptF/LPS export ABC transporter permease LptG